MMFSFKSPSMLLLLCLLQLSLYAFLVSAHPPTDANNRRQKQDGWGYGNRPGWNAEWDNRNPSYGGTGWGNRRPTYGSGPRGFLPRLWPMKCTRRCMWRNGCVMGGTNWNNRGWSGGWWDHTNNRPNRRPNTGGRRPNRRPNNYRPTRNNFDYIMQCKRRCRMWCWWILSYWRGSGGYGGGRWSWTQHGSGGGGGSSSGGWGNPGSGGGSSGGWGNPGSSPGAGGGSDGGGNEGGRGGGGGGGFGWLPPPQYPNTDGRNGQGNGNPSIPWGGGGPLDPMMNQFGGNNGTNTTTPRNKTDNMIGESQSGGFSDGSMFSPFDLEWLDLEHLNSPTNSTG